ncbi:MAG: glycoside hydrolase family 11 protein [Polyangiaceae bacterium]|nr:glycoside hydrolase family 11 protein [Polyangiaceae bacterium]
MPGPRQFRSSLRILAACFAVTACSDSGTSSGSETGGTSTGAATGGSATGGSSAAAGSGGVTNTGGVGVSGGSRATGGGSGTGGVSATGGLTSTGGVTNTGGSTATGGRTGSGGASATGGLTSTGGVTSSGGVTSTGGATTTGGSTMTGGSSGSGGVPATGGAATGGVEGGSTGGGGAGTGGTDATGGTANTCPPATPLTGGSEYCSNQKGDAGHGYSFELWASEGGEGCMTVRRVDANFGATWGNVDDFLARVGLDFDRTKTPAQIGDISAEFAETKTGDTGLVYVGVYGWTVDPLREYYILDDWGTTQPGDTASDGTPRDHAGTITVDGDTYEVWTHTRVDKPAITGDSETFDQYFSVRRTARQCGHISISEHFSEWTRLGLNLGKLVEAKLLVEAQNGSGTLDFTTATVVVE